MKCRNLLKRTGLAARARRAVSCIALGLSLTLGVILGASAQKPNDTLAPTPYSWPNVHAGGTAPGMIPGVGVVVPPNGLANFLMGTPTGINTTTNTFDEISSFLLGNYDPAQPPGASDFANPNNFRDAAPFDILSWSSPYTFTYPTPIDASLLTVDDRPGGTSNYSEPTGTWNNVTGDGTATNSEYEVDAVTPGVVADSNDDPDLPAGLVPGQVVNDGATATAQWTLTVPANNTNTKYAGFYIVTVHLPDTTAVPNDGTSVTTPATIPITDAHYIIQNTTAQKNVLANVRISQTESNANEFLAGPFFLTPGQSITVTLDNTTKMTPVPANGVVIADSVALQPGFGSNVESTPTAINETEFPEIQNAFYYGVGSQSIVNGQKQSAGTPDVNPRGNTTVDPAPKSDYSNTTGQAFDIGHRIRSLVYYGRQENIILQDTKGNLVDVNGNATTTPVTAQVGAIYCADGFTGSVVWRYQTPAILTAQTDAATGKTTYVPSQLSREVFSSPAVARINVEVPMYKYAPTSLPSVSYSLQTRLVVIVGDNNGLVYCLDAVGNRNGTSNNNAVSANDQPIFNPTAGLNDVTTSGPAHAGTTPVYWIYRPDPTQPKDIAKGTVKTADPTSDLPVPGSFGTASPVVYVDPTAPADTMGAVPGDLNPSVNSVGNNAYIYMGNNNGVLYKFLAAGGVDSTKETFNGSLAVGDLEFPFIPQDPARAAIPTCQPAWWMPLDGAKTIQGGSPTTGSYESIVSAPAVRAADSTSTNLTFRAPGSETIYFTSADDTDNEGRLYAINGTGPTDVNGTLLTPGTTGYNDNATTFWEFPNRYVRPNSPNPAQHALHPTIGSITGSPVVFTNPDGVFDLRDPATRQMFPSVDTFSPATTPWTRIYFAACSGVEPTDPSGVRPTINETGRIWAVEADTLTATFPGPPTSSTTIYPGMAAWAFPDTIDPNAVSPASVTLSASASGASDPLGAFRYVTPAIGLVQFPSLVSSTYVTGAGPGTPYSHTDQSPARTFTLNGTKDGPTVPMLYVGSSGTGVGQQGPRFYGLDLDGVDDAGRTIFQDNTGASATPALPPVPGIVSPAGNIQTSAALVVNSSTPTTGKFAGNGGVLFFSSGATLYQISATPVTPRDPAATDVAVPVQAIVSGTGPLSAPSVSGASVFDAVSFLNPKGTIPTTGVYSGANVTDWVYFSDSGQGIAEGITPKNQNGGLGTGLTNIVPVNPIPPNVIISQFPLYTYEFDGSTAHPGTSTDMTKANRIGDQLPLFEWGQDVYIRIGNVVPPNPTNDPLLRIYDPATLVAPSGGGPGPDLNQAIFFTNGGPVTIQISDLDAGGNNNQPLQTDTGQVPAIVINPPPTGTPPPAGVPIGNGFFKRSDTSSGSPAHFIPAVLAAGGLPAVPAHTNEQLGAANSTYTTVDGTPTGVDNGWIAAYTYAIRDGTARHNTPGTTRRVVTATQVAQAYSLTFDMASNAYVPVFKQSVTLQTTITQGGEATSTTETGQRTVVAITPVEQPTFGILNPLAAYGGGVPLFVQPTFSTPNAAKTLGDIVGPFAGIDTTKPLTQDDLPALANGNRYPSNVNQIPVNGVVTVPNRGVNGRYQRSTITTTTGQISHNSSGDNATPTGGAAPVGSTNNAVGNGGLAARSSFGKYALNVGDRSALGLIGLSLLNVTLQSADLRWNDNTVNATTGQPNLGAGAVVNYLPWEKLPSSAGAGANASLDYPDIAKKSMSAYLYGNGGGQIGPIANIPQAPNRATAGAGGNGVPNRLVYADPIQEQIRVPRYQPANLQIFDAAPGGGFGGIIGPITPGAINTGNPEFPMGYTATQQYIYVDTNRNHQYDDGEAYRVIRTFTGVPVDMTATIENTTIDLGKLPHSFGVQTDTFATLGTFSPYTAAFQSFFKALTVLNRGNTNWLNVHVDQKIGSGGAAFSALPINSAALDPLVSIPAYDQYGITGTPAQGVQPYLVRSSLDPDLVTLYGRNPAVAAAAYSGFYPGATFHKARVGSGTPTLLRVPDEPDNALLPSRTAVPTIGSSSVPYVGLALPLGTPVGTYAQNVRVYEGMDPGGVSYKPPTYNRTDISGATITGTAQAIGKATPANLNDALELNNGIPQQPYSTATVIKGTVTEARGTDGFSNGAIPQIDPVQVPAADFLPSAFADPNTGNMSLYWTSSRNPTATVPYNVYGVNLKKTAVAGAFVPNVAGGNVTSWWTPLTMPTTTATSSINVIHDQTLPDGKGAFTADDKAYAFVQSVSANVGAAYTDKLLCFPVTPSSGALTGNGVQVVQNTGQVVNGVRGLKFEPKTLPNGGFTDPLGASVITNDLWAFWYGGTRGRSAIYFASAQSSAVDGGATGAFSTPAILPIPAGLTSVADPSALVTFAPDAKGNEIPVIEVTYTGVAPDGNADIYVSRYRPFIVQNSSGVAETDANGNKVVGLALVAAPTITEQMQADSGLLYYQARDVAWSRPTATTGIEVYVYGQKLGLATRTPVYDRASGMLIYSGLGSITVPNTLPNPTPTSRTVTINTVYVDLARGRVRFSPQLPASLAFSGMAQATPVSQTQGASVYATFSPSARRITTDTRADTQPVAFLDQTYKANDLATAVPTAPRVQTDRYWFLWRKSGASGTSTKPTLWFKTQRLTLYLHDANNNAVSLVPTSAVTMTDNSTTNAIPANSLSQSVDVDWVRGRLYFPEVIGGIPTEGHNITVVFFTVGPTGQPVKNTLTDAVHWLDEPRTNDITLGQTTPAPPNANNDTTASLASATGEAGIPMDTIVNESNVTAFLDPTMYQFDTQGGTNATDVPHKIWLFWNSTRNGTADIYYETIAPRFSPVVSP